MRDPIICHYCNIRPATGRDHVIPRIVGGPDGGWNRVPACLQCDNAKGSKTYESFTGKPTLPQAHIDKGFTTSDMWAIKHGWVDFETWRHAELRSRNDARFRGRNHSDKQERKRLKKAYRRALVNSVMNGGWHLDEGDFNAEVKALRDQMIKSRNESPLDVAHRVSAEINSRQRVEPVRSGQQAHGGASGDDLGDDGRRPG